MIYTNKSAVYVIQEPGSEVKAAQEAAGTQSTKSQRPIRRYVIICVTCLLIVALLVIGALVAVKLITDTEKEIFTYQRQFQSGNISIEDGTYTDDDDQSTSWVYHVKNETTSDDTWGLVDYDRHLQVIKIVDKTGGSACFVELNVTTEKPSSDYTPTVDEVMKPTTSPVTFKVSGPLSETSSIFGPTEEKMCSGATVYLIERVPDTTTTTPATAASRSVSSLPQQQSHPSRRRRFYRCNRVWVCQNMVLDAYTFYGCPPVCTWVDS